MIIKLNCIAFKLLHSETQRIFIHILDCIGLDDDVGWSIYISFLWELILFIFFNWKRNKKNCSGLVEWTQKP